MKRSLIKRAQGIDTQFPHLHTIFVGNRAVVSYQREDMESPSGHIEVHYGPFFGLRLAMATMRVERRLVRSYK